MGTIVRFHGRNCFTANLIISRRVTSSSFSDIQAKTRSHPAHLPTALIKMKSCSFAAAAFAATMSAHVIARTSADMVVLAQFNGTDESVKWKWRDLNDPVMGGQSTSTFSWENDDGIAIFNGTTRVVPSLKAPGYRFILLFFFRPSGFLLQIRSLTQFRVFL